ncbi:MAG: hypothetical protein FJ096_02075 [Deltaproteobacteria bacterium]|nr:hypothetical protein [Deltaproteobacteria bacterium]
MSPTARLTGLALGGMWLGASCVLPPVALVDREEAGGSKGGDVTSSGGEAGNGGNPPTTCVHARWPEPPSATVPGGAEIEVIAAVRAIDIGEGAPDLSSLGPARGYDLDQFCTGEGDGSSCLLPEGGNPAASKDGPGGIDNASAVLFGAIKAFEPLLDSARFSEGADRGDWSLLVRVQGYNGLPDDSEVTVSLYPSPGLRAEKCVSMDAVPKWDGTDAWPVGTSALKMGSGTGDDGGRGTCSPGVPGYSFDRPRFTDPKAYVSGGQVVANLPDVEITAWLAKSPLVLRLKAGFVTGKLVKVGSGYGIEGGRFVGRWPTSAMLRQLAASVTSELPVCTDNPIYKLLKDGVCDARDVTSTLGGPTTPCDALSIGIAFEAAPATLGAVVPLAPSESECPPELDPANDDCSP